MTVTLTTGITSNYWSMSSSVAGAIVTDYEDLVQQVLIALSTNKGSVPFDPEFGFNLTALLDEPVDVVIPTGKIAILETLERDVPQITVEAVAHRFDVPAHVTFYVLCSTNLGNFVVQMPLNPNFTPTAQGPFQAGAFNSGFQGF